MAMALRGCLAAAMARGGGTRRERTLCDVLGRFLGDKLIPDLKARAEGSESVRRELERTLAHERSEGRTADDYLAFRDRMLEQVGAAWLLSAVFVRYLEDQGLIEHRRIAGDGAEDSQERFNAAFPSLAANAREYLLAVFRECARLPGAREVLGPESNPLYRLGPSTTVVAELLELFRERRPDGALQWRFDSPATATADVTAPVAPTADTRVLGDLYQDLSAGVRERYALLQTPDFVEEFILARTLDPAVKEFGLDGLRVIDPTCGSGHFLLGAFERLRAMHQKAAPAADPKQWARDALDHVYGVDLNPYAVAISRFRLLIAFVRAAGIRTLREAPADLALDRHVVVADSLLYGGKGQKNLVEQGSVTNAITREKIGSAAFSLEDPAAAHALFARRFHAVVGNPPYITCKDAALRKRYSERYPDSAIKLYALAAPFTERFFELATQGGYVGLINANSFMKREFGKGLIEKVLPRVALSHVVDTSGAFIPGHGTPTVILFGRNERGRSPTVRTVMGKRGEPETPADAAKGKVWSGIVEGIDAVGYEDEFVSVAEVDRASFTKHPWSLGGGGASELKELIEHKCPKRLSEVVDDVGLAVILGEDELFMLPRNGAATVALPKRPLVTGEDIRDWGMTPSSDTIFSFDEQLKPQPNPRVLRYLWPFRRVLEERIVSGSTSMRAAGKPWYDVRRLARDKLRTPLSITFPAVATHNHFALDRGGTLFKDAAPIIKLPEGATEEDHRRRKLAGAPEATA